MEKAIKFYWIILTTAISFGVEAQSSFKPSYESLKKYEGTYEYLGNTTVEIAPSPKDTLLYAIIGESKYKLRSVAEDEFLNGANQRVQFLTNGSGQYGYRVDDATPNRFYKQISKTVTYNKNMWFPRIDARPWRYQEPPDLKDGLSTGSLVESGLDTSLIHSLVARVVSGVYNDVHSVLIMRNGNLVFEEYFYGYDVNTKHQLRSATKSFTAALVGIAIDKLMIKHKDERIMSYFPEYKIENADRRKGLITVEHLLTQRSGFACDDDDQSSPGNEVKIYPTQDWIKTVLNLPMIYMPGKEAQYCSGNVLVLNRMIEIASDMKLRDFAKKHLFDKMGIKDFSWEFVPHASHQDSFSQLLMRPRDMMKFGKLYLDGGKWNGEQLLSRQWVDATFTRQSSIRGLGYSYLWWCEDLVVNGKTFRGIAAKGNGGQRIFIWPEENMIAVVTSGAYNAQSSANKLLMECVLSGIRK